MSEKKDLVDKIKIDGGEIDLTELPDEVRGLKTCSTIKPCPRGITSLHAPIYDSI